MKIEAWYSNNFDSRLGGRFITLEHINPLLKKYEEVFDISSIGVSELGKDIPLIKIGGGNKKVLAWSQMHGNETTTTKSIFDFLKFLTQKDLFQDEISDFLYNYTLHIIPILNPDGAASYIRENSNLIDLNRDAQDLSQKESKLLTEVFKIIKPDLCLNLHGQRTIFGLESGLPATISFLSPASNVEREVTPSRIEAMELIAKMNFVLQEHILGQVGRYDDSFNSNCFGDAFQMKDVPVILFEAGHCKNDYKREKTREYVFYSLLALFGIIETGEVGAKDYFSIPENKKNFRDIIIRNVRFKEEDEPFSLVIQYKEKLSDGKIRLVPKLDSVGVLEDLFGHVEVQGNNKLILVNSQSKIEIEDEVSTILDKNDNSLVYFIENGI